MTFVADSSLSLSLRVALILYFPVGCIANLGAINIDYEILLVWMEGGKLNLIPAFGPFVMEKNDFLQLFGSILRSSTMPQVFLYGFKIFYHFCSEFF